MTAGVKYLHRETPTSHGILESIAWAVGSGIAIALASRLSKTHRLAIGIWSSFVSASVWIALLFFLRVNLDQASGNGFFGHSISLGHYLIGFSLLILIVGFAGSFLGATSRNDEELTSEILLIRSRHWLWLWIAGFGWVSMLPLVAYYIWLGRYEADPDVSRRASCALVPCFAFSSERRYRQTERCACIVGQPSMVGSLELSASAILAL